MTFCDILCAILHGGVTMKEVIFEILNDMAEDLTVAQLKKLQEVLLNRFSKNENQPEHPPNKGLSGYGYNL